MLIVCKTCASSYHIPREILGDDGCQLRCVGCGETWMVAADALAAGAAPFVEGARGRNPPALIAPNAVEDRIAKPARAVSGVWDGRIEETPPPGAPASPQRRNRAAVAAAIVAMIVGAMAIVAGRSGIVRAAPNTARIFAAIGLPVNLRGLSLDNVRTNIFDLGDKKILVIEGAIVNLRDARTEAPNMRIALRGADKRELYVWTAPAPKSSLAPSEHLPFRTRLASPPEGASEVLVKFASVGDKLSPMKDGP